MELENEQQQQNHTAKHRSAEKAFWITEIQKRIKRGTRPYTIKQQRTNNNKKNYTTKKTSKK